MLIAIDANVLTRENRTGTERYVFELVRAMKEMPLREGERVRLYASAPLPELDPLPPGWEVRVLGWRLPFKGWTHIRLSAELLAHTPDVFFSPAHEVPLATGRTKIVSTVHDVAFRRLADIYPPKGKDRQEWAIRRAIKKADRLIVISRATKNDLAELYAVPNEQMRVVHEAVREEAFRTGPEAVRTVLETYGLTKNDYFVSIGRVEKKKNIAMLVRAFSQFKQGTGSTAKLVLGGNFGFGREEIEAAIAASNAKADILVLGYVPESDLAPLLNGATAYVFPSLYEGFGIPVLEAMAAGIPLLASDIPSLREIAGDAALFARPADESAWVQNLTAIEHGDALRGQLMAKGAMRVGDFSWKKCAEETWEVLRGV